MKKWMGRVLAGTMVLSLLTGCRGGEASPTGTPSPSGEAAAPEETAVAVPAPGSDLTEVVTDGLMTRDLELVTVDGEPVAAEEYLYWLLNSIQIRDSSGLLGTEDAWDSGVVAEMKEEALSYVRQYQVVENKARELGVTLTQEEEAQAEEQLNSVIEQSGGLESFQDILDSMCITLDTFREMNKTYFRYNAIMAKLEQAGELEATEEDIDQYITNNGAYAAKHILISTRVINEDSGTYEDLPEEEQAQKLALAQDLRQQLRDGGDTEELFDELMKEYSEDSRDENGDLYMPDGYSLVPTGYMVSEFEEGALALKEGEISEPVKSQFGYHIILRIPVDREQARKECEGEYKMNLLLGEWMDQAKITTAPEYDQLDPKAFYENINAINAARQAQRAAEATPTPGPEETPAASGEPVG